MLANIENFNNSTSIHWNKFIRCHKKISWLRFNYRRNSSWNSEQHLNGTHKPSKLLHFFKICSFNVESGGSHNDTETWQSSQYHYVLPTNIAFASAIKITGKNVSSTSIANQGKNWCQSINLDSEKATQPSTKSIGLLTS